MRACAFYNELVHAVVEAGKSQYLQGKLAKWRLRRADGVVPS